MWATGESYLRMSEIQYSFEQIEIAIYNELVDTHSRYKFLVEIVFPLLNQNLLRKAYPGILTRLEANSCDGVIIGISKLIDNSNKSKLIHFKRFIKIAEKIPTEKVKNQSQWQEFLKESALFLKDIEQLNRNLSPLRNKFRVHISPAVPDALEITTWEYWRKVLERMENIFNLYQGAIKDASTVQFWTVNFDYEPKAFLEWCRLDDFEKHRKQEIENRHL